MTSRRLQITLKRHVLRWARQRTGHSKKALAKKIPVKTRERHPMGTDRQNQRRSGRQTRRQDLYTPRYLYLDNPPDESLPFQDFRTCAGQPPNRPSPNLPDTIYQMRPRQAWLRDELIEYEEDPLPFVGDYSPNDDHTKVSVAMRAVLNLDTGWAAKNSTGNLALSHLRNQFDQIGVLVVFNGIVGNNTTPNSTPPNSRVSPSSTKSPTSSPANPA